MCIKRSIKSRQMVGSSNGTIYDPNTSWPFKILMYPYFGSPLYSDNIRWLNINAMVNYNFGIRELARRPRPLTKRLNKVVKIPAQVQRLPMFESLTSEHLMHWTSWRMNPIVLRWTVSTWNKDRCNLLDRQRIDLCIIFGNPIDLFVTCKYRS